MDIVNYLPPASHWKDTILYFPEIDSTNNRAKALAQAGAPAGTVVVADCQSAGRGRMGRQFQSPAGVGLYLTVILRPDCKATELMHLTCAVAVTVCDACEKALSFRPGVKWINDLVFGGKKLGGILTEMALKPGTDDIDYALVGIGINCCQTSRAEFPLPVQDIAASLAMVTGKPVCREKLCAEIIWQLESMPLLSEKDALMAQYRKDCITLGKEILLVNGETKQPATALSVDENGGLVVQLPSGEITTVTSGEASIRTQNGYA